MSSEPKSESFHLLLRRVTEGGVLSREEARRAIGEIAEGRVGDVETAALLVAWKTRGETPEEVAGVVSGFRDRMIPVRCTAKNPIDTCGTGGDGSGTFNVSTAAALVAAGAGAPVAKHGNRAVSSRSGSADVLAELGISLDLSPEHSGQVLDEVGLVFLFAPNFHPALARVASVRRTLGFRTIFNIVGPLVNPAGVRRQVLGVYRKGLLPLVAGALAELGTDHAMVVHAGEGELGLDEITTTGPTIVFEVAGRTITEHLLVPEDYGFARVPLRAIEGGGPVENAGLIRKVLGGEPGAPRDIVIFNAGAAIYVSGLAKTIADGILMAKESIDSGRARGALDRLSEMTTALSGGSK